MLETKRVATLEQVVQGIVPTECLSMDRESAHAFILDTLRVAHRLTTLSRLAPTTPQNLQQSFCCFSQDKGRCRILA